MEKIKTIPVPDEMRGGRSPYGIYDPNFPRGSVDFQSLIVDRLRDPNALNPYSGPKGDRDGVTKVFEDYVSWAKKHPILLQEKTVEVMFSMNDAIFSLFIPYQSDKAVFTWSEVNMTELFKFEPNSMKAPTRKIHTSTSHHKEFSQFTGIGYEIDWHHLQTDEGAKQVTLLNNYVHNLTNIYMTLVAYRVFFNKPSFYQRPEQLWTPNQIPVSIDDALQKMKMLHGAFCKGQAEMKNVLSYADRVFNQTNNKLGRILVTIDFINYLKSKTTDARKGSVAGVEEAMNNREDPFGRWTLMGRDLIVAPLTSMRLHGQSDEYIMYALDSKGSFWRFPLNFIEDVPPKEFVFRKMTTVKAYSYETDKLDEYEFLDFLKRCPEFVPVDTSQGLSLDYAGEINYPLLDDFVKNLSGIDYAKTYRNRYEPKVEWNVARNGFKACRMEFTPELFKRKLHKIFHQFINFPYVNEQNDSKAFPVVTPVRCIGEINECHLPYDAILYCYRNFTHRLFDDLEEYEMTQFLEGLRLIDTLNNPQGKDLRAINQTITDGGDDILDVNEFGFAEYYKNFLDVGSGYLGLGSIPAFLTIEDQVNNGGRDPKEEVVEKALAYLAILRKIVKRFGEITNNHIAGASAVDNVIPRFMQHKNMRPETKELIAFHHLLVRPNHIPFVKITKRDSTKPIVPFPFFNDSSTVPADEIKFDIKRFDAFGHLEAESPSSISRTFLGAGSNITVRDKLFLAHLARAEKTGDFTNVMDIDFDLQREKWDKYGIEKLLVVREELKDNEIHPVALQHIIYNIGYNEHFNKRWEHLNKPFISEFTRIAGRAVLLDMVDLKEFEKQQECNRVCIFSGKNLRGDEAQFMNSIPMVAQGDVGLFYYDKDFRITGFAPGDQSFFIQTFARYAPVIKDKQKFFIVENAFGGPALGGKGRHYVNELDKICPTDHEKWRAMVSKIGSGDKLGFYCITPVLQSAAAGMQKIYRKDIDRRGNFSSDDFIGKYENNDAFRPVKDAMYDNCIFANYVYRFPTVVFPIQSTKEMSFMDRHNFVNVNNICCETTTEIYDHFSSTQRKLIDGCHFWGKQGPGSFNRETGIVGPSYANDYYKMKEEKDTQRKRTLSDMQYESSTTDIFA